MVERGVQIIIPAYNQADKLDVTMESIRNQNFDSDSIYVTIIDFGSNDGTYERALSYDRKHLGVHERPFQKNVRQRLADAALVLKYLGTASLYEFSIVLYPGDIMYPNCLSVMTEHYTKYFGLNPSVVFCESDLFKEDGTVDRQKPLFPESRIIDGSREVSEYIRRGYRHQIFQATLRLSQVRRKDAYDNNEGRCFNKLANRGLNRVTVYIKEPLVCTNRIIYEDELQEILYRWESSIAMDRTYCASRGYHFDVNFVELASENLAEYALWRSFCLYKQENLKASEDCFLISRVISPKIENKKIYQDMKCLFSQKNLVFEQEIAQYFRE